MCCILSSLTGAETMADLSLILGSLFLDKDPGQAPELQSRDLGDLFASLEEEQPWRDSDGDPNAQPVLEASPPWRFLNTFLPPASGASCLSRRLLLAADLPSGTAGPAIMSSSIMTLCSFSLFCSVHLSFWGVPDLRIRQDPGQLQGAAGEGPGRGVGASGRSETQPEGAPPPPGTEAELPGTSAFALLPEAPVAVAVSLHPDLDLELVGGSRRETQPEEAAAAGAKENTGSYTQPGGGNQGGL
ncbi:uncharacterized protein LOC144584685 [Pogona vitticeps]